jgi:hypothetical protein
MCLACDMEGLWFAVMEARANAAGEATGVDQQDEPATLLAPSQQEGAATLLPPPERGREHIR